MARQALVRKLEDLRRLEGLLSGSKLEPAGVENLGRKVKDAVWKRHLRETARSR